MDIIGELFSVAESHHLEIVLILTIGFTLASILGYLCEKCKISPILGYLLSGYCIGPFFPGFVANLQIAEQLAEVGVVLMMFGVGLQFKWRDLAKVRHIAVPGALGQTFTATVTTVLAVHMIGGSWTAGLLIGLAICVSSTVLLVRVLIEQNLLSTPQGSIAVGWTIVEDIVTVFVLILIPAFVVPFSNHVLLWSSLFATIGIIVFKFLFLIVLMFTIGSRIINYFLSLVARTRSHELFTLSVLASTLLIATGSSVFFGTSIALGAFIAGMVIGQTVLKHQASAYASPLKDAFLVIFFLSVGMIFNPFAIHANLSLFITLLTVILIVKPLAAFIIVTLFRYPFKTAFTIALALAQIGEFSFILMEEALKFKLVSDEAYDVIVACALVSISLNPLLFRFFNKQLNQEEPVNQVISNELYCEEEGETTAVLIGFGSSGRQIIKGLTDINLKPIIIDQNVDAVSELVEENFEAFYGDASVPRMLEIGYLESAKILIINHLHIDHLEPVVKAARQLQPLLPIFVRVRSLEDKKILKEYGIDRVYSDEEEGLKVLLESLKMF